VRTEHSRGIRLAAAASGEDESRLEARLSAATVAVSVDTSVLGAFEVLALLLETLRRGPGHLRLDPTGLTPGQVGDLLRVVHSVSVGVGLELGAAPADATRVRIARQAPVGVICILADGHGVRLVTDGRRLDQHRPPSGLGVVCTAAFGAAEVFKYTAGIATGRCVLHRELAFCPVTLGRDLAVAPMLPDAATVSLGLAGSGAVGTAHARILGGLELGGSRALVIDPEVYAPENVGTYSLGTLADSAARRPKVELAAHALPGWRVSTVHGRAADAVTAIDSNQIFCPSVVLSGLDSIAARHEAQGIWPDRMIDAATGDTAVGLHEATPEGPCLRCLLPPRVSDRSPVQALADELGLPIELVARGDVALRAEHLGGVSAEQRERLASQIGKPICGLASALGLIGDAADDYRPSVPFVSQQAACLGVGRLLANMMGICGLPNVLQYDTMIGPQSMTRMDRRAQPGCYCQTRSSTIKLVRSTRKRASNSAMRDVPAAG
jgi:hypothetical protein